MTTIEAIRVLLPAFIGIWISTVWRAWRSGGDDKLAIALHWSFWMVFVVLLLAASWLWNVAQA